jgi:hypothetical protein
MLRWLVIGIGDITTKRVIPALLEEKRSELWGIVTRDPGKAAPYGVRAFTDLDAALAAGPWHWLVPVPLHPTKQRQREFNQAERLADRLSEATRIPVHRGLLRRVAPTRTQTLLNRQERLANMARAFALRRGARLHGERLVLVDDVLTTGATTGACAGVLLAGGAGEVCVWTVARGIWILCRDAWNEDHRECALACANKGAPLGIEANDGNYYIAVSPEHPMASANSLLSKYAEQKVKVISDLYPCGVTGRLHPSTYCSRGRKPLPLRPDPPAGSVAAAAGPPIWWNRLDSRR